MIALRTVIATAVIGLGILLSANTTATAEYDAFAALKAYDSADPANRKVWELIFGNTQNGINKSIETVSQTERCNITGGEPAAALAHRT